MILMGWMWVIRERVRDNFKVFVLSNGKMGLAFTETR